MKNQRGRGSDRRESTAKNKAMQVRIEVRKRRLCVRSTAQTEDVFLYQPPKCRLRDCASSQVEEAARQSSSLEQGKQSRHSVWSGLSTWMGVMTKTVHGSVEEAADPWTAIYCAEERANRVWMLGQSTRKRAPPSGTYAFDVSGDWWDMMGLLRRLDRLSIRHNLNASSLMSPKLGLRCCSSTQRAGPWPLVHRVGASNCLFDG
jgi:hypothetical protein